MSERIDQFRGEHFFLSNMYPLEYRILSTRNMGAATVEHAYQAAKFLSPKTHFDVLNASSAVRGFGERLDGIAAKNMAHALIENGEPVIADWEENKRKIMRDAVVRKFIANPTIREMLFATGTAELVEGNDWGDTFWGVDLATNQGENNLGEILMEVRSSLAKDFAA